MPDSEEIKAIDLGDDPVAPPPTTPQQTQMRAALKAVFQEDFDAVSNRVEAVEEVIPQKADLSEGGLLLDSQTPEAALRKDVAHRQDVSGDLRMIGSSTPRLSLVGLAGGTVSMVIDPYSIAMFSGSSSVGAWGINAPTTANGLRITSRRPSGTTYTAFLPAENGTLLTDVSTLSALRINGIIADANLPAGLVAWKNIDPASKADSTSTESSIAALRQYVDATKQPQGGVHFEFGSPSAEVPITSADLAILNGFTFELVAKVTESGAISGLYRSLFGSLRGVGSFYTWGIGLARNTSGAVIIVYEAGGTTNKTAATTTVYPLGSVFHCIGEYDATTGIAKITTSDGEEASANWGAISLTSIRPLTIMRAASGGSTGNDDARSAAGTVYKAAIYSRILTPDEKQELFASGGQIVPLSARGDCIIDLPCDEGTGYQLRDRSGNGNHALLTETGCTHLIPGDGTPISAESVNASSATYLLRSGAILPSSAVVVGAIVDGSYLAAEGAQNLTHDRIRLNPSGGNLQVQRSNGTTHQTLATFTPASLASVNVTIIYRLIK